MLTKIPREGNLLAKKVLSSANSALETILKQDRTESYQITAAVQFRDVANCHFLFYVERLFSKNDRQFPFRRNKMAVLWIFQEKKI